MKLRILAAAIAAFALAGCAGYTMMGGGGRADDRCKPCTVTITVADDPANPAKCTFTSFSPDPVYPEAYARVPIRFELAGPNYYSYSGNGVTFKDPPINPKAPGPVFQKDAGQSGPQVIVYVDDRTHPDQAGSWRYGISVAGNNRSCSIDPMVDNN